MIHKLTRLFTAAFCGTLGHTLSIVLLLRLIGIAPGEIDSESWIVIVSAGLIINLGIAFGAWLTDCSANMMITCGWFTAFWLGVGFLFYVRLAGYERIPSSSGVLSFFVLDGIITGFWAWLGTQALMAPPSCPCTAARTAKRGVPNAFKDGAQPKRGN